MTPAESPPLPGPHRAALVGGAGVVATTIAWTMSDHPGIALVVAAAVIVGTGVYLALARFEAFLLALLVVRPIADLGAGKEIAGLDATSVLGAFMVLSTATWLWINRDRSVRRPVSALTIAIIGFAVISVLATLGSRFPTVSLIETLRVVSGVLMYLAVDHLLANGMPRRRLLLALGAATIFPLLYSLGGVLGLEVTHAKDGVTALKSTFFLSNNFGHFLAPFIVLAASIALRSRGRTRWLLLTWTLVATVQLVLTLTRGAWLAVVLGVVLVSLVEHRKMALRFVACVAVLVLFVPAVNQRVTNLDADPDAFRTQNSWQWRLDYWGEVMTLADQDPVLGIGPGSALQAGGKDPHNDYVRAYVESGIAGLLAYLLMLGAMVAITLRAVARSDPDNRAIPMGIAAYTLAFSVVSFAENLVTSGSFMWYFMALLAIANVAVHPPAQPPHQGSREQRSPSPVVVARGLR